MSHDHNGTIIIMIMNDVMIIMIIKNKNPKSTKDEGSMERIVGYSNKLIQHFKDELDKTSVRMIYL